MKKKNLEPFIVQAGSIDWDLPEANLQANLKKIIPFLDFDFLLLSVQTSETEVTVIETISAQNPGPLKKLTYSLSDSPCRFTFKNKQHLVPKNAKKLFPRFPFFSHYNQDAYIGTSIPFYFGMNQLILIGLSKAHIRNELLTLNCMKLLASGIQIFLLRHPETLVHPKRIQPDTGWHQLLRQSINQIPAVFFVKDLQGKYLDVNQAYLDLFRLRKEDVIGKTDWQLFSEPYAKRFRENDLRVIREGGSIREEEKVQDYQNEEKIFESLKFPFLDDQKKIYAVGGVSIEITAKKRAIEALELERLKSLHAGKLASIGKMMSGIAHDLNNPLTIIKTASELIQQDLESRNLESISEQLSRIHKAVDRTHSLVQKLLNFSRQDRIEKTEVFSLSTLVTTSEELLFHQLMKHQVKLIQDFPTELLIKGKLVSLSQALINLLQNSIHAIQDLNERWIKLEGFVKPQHIIVDVIDSGNGLDETAQKELFEPFFTTKKPGQGTGLGLDLAKSIIEEHEGKIEYLLKEGHTCFRLTLPRHDCLP